MTSELAIGEINRLKAEGLEPTVRDIIRLNALALGITAARGKRPTADIYLLPRVAALTKDVYFRQPTIGHDIWIRNVLRFVSPDFESVLAVNAFALSRGCDSLPDPLDVAAVESAVNAFAKSMEGFTRSQLLFALDYVKNGCDPDSGESAPPTESSEITEDEEITAAAADWDECIALGNLFEGAAILYGISLAEMKRMTRRQLNETIRLSAKFHDIRLDDGVHLAEGRFYAALNEIKERLMKEREENGRQ